MKIPVIIAALLITVFSGCSRHGEARHQPDPGIQMALDELTRLKSVTDVGLTYGEYSERLLTGKGNIDVGLLRSNDEAAKPRIKAALASYVAARNEWKRSHADEEATPDIQAMWRNAELAARKAAEYASAGQAVRKQIDQEDAEEAKRKTAIEDARKAREAALAAKQDQVSSELEKAKSATEEAAARQKAEDDKRFAAEAAAREKARRYAPAGTGFNINPIPITTSDTVTTIPAGTALQITGTNADGTAHVKIGEIETNLPSSEITNDRDLAALLRANEASKQEAIRQWRTHLAVAVQEARDNAPKPTPPPAPEGNPSTIGVKSDYVSPLEQPAQPVH